LAFCQEKKGMEIHAWCIMTSHLPLVFRSTAGQNPELLLGDFKRFTSRRIVKAIEEHPRCAKCE
jgi:REP element-mobilizing transposase RayT